jgi:hypothetical protein
VRAVRRCQNARAPASAVACNRFFVLFAARDSGPQHACIWAANAPRRALTNAVLACARVGVNCSAERRGWMTETRASSSSSATSATCRWPCGGATTCGCRCKTAATWKQCCCEWRGACRLCVRWVGGWSALAGRMMVDSGGGVLFTVGSLRWMCCACGAFHVAPHVPVRADALAWVGRWAARHTLARSSSQTRCSAPFSRTCTGTPATLSRPHGAASS